jgi:cell wall-associated NlpC family hydrolase
MRIPFPGRSAVTGDQIAADALRYTGHPYVYSVWDCSSFVNHVLGQDLGLALPGGTRGYKGPPPHGPVVLDYAAWRGAVTVQAPARGDLAVWPGDGPNGHIGIVLGPDEMVSALDPAQGTAKTPIHGYGPPGVQVEYRRVTGVTAGAPAGPGGAAGGGAAGPASGLAAPAVALLVVAGMAAAVVGGAALLGIGAVLLGEWALIKAGQQ